MSSLAGTGQCRGCRYWGEPHTVKMREGDLSIAFCEAKAMHTAAGASCFAWAPKEDAGGRCRDEHG